MSCLFDIAMALAAEPGEATGDQIYQRFQAEPDTLSIAIVGDDGRPVGIIERNAFFLAMASEFGRAIYARRPISILMSREPLIVDGAEDLMAFCAETLRERPSELLRGFIVTRGGVYVGVGTALGLLQAAAHADRDRALEMSGLAERLDSALAKAEMALEAKARFLTVMSHELRTPLNGVLTVAEILGLKMGASPLRSYVGTIQDSGRQLLRLVNDVLDLSRSGFEDMVLAAAPFSLKDLARETGALWSTAAAQEGLAFSTAYIGDDDLMLAGDAARLRQILDNLTANAVKFTPAGWITLVVHAEGEGEVRRVILEVRDTGPGVPPKDLELIFTPFSAHAMDHDRGGAGTGLAIARRIVGRMGGEISAEANPGGGLCVRATLSLPVATVEGRSGAKAA